MATMQNRHPPNQQHLLPVQMQFNESMMSHPDILQQGNMGNPAVSQMNPNFLQPNMPVGDNQQMKQMQVAALPPPGTISLSTLIDFVVYKTYHDITVMADILPSKTDMERKIAIVEFSTRTRQLFIRLLSLVKWASSVGKVVKCSESSAFLDRQTMMFVDVADKLHILANQLVVQARLPNFSIPAAVDVLTTGTYPRLPLCIRDRIIPQDPILPKEKKATLKRIDQIVLYRLVTEVIPPQIMAVKVERGVVHLLVPNEFKASITLMGDSSDIPWRILKLEFLVEDLNIGSGRSLVHSLQVNYIHELVQSRMFASEQPLTDLYNILHSFCLSLQLEVLHAQAERLSKLRWGKFIQIEEYLPGQKLSVSYWRLNPFKTQTTPFVVSVRQSPTNSSKPLQVQHAPKMPLDDVDLVESCSHIKNLSLEYLIHQSICTRSFHILSELKQMLHKHIRNDASHFSEGSKQSAVLHIPLLEPWKESECLRILVDPQTGILSPSLDQISESMIEKMEKEINDSHATLLSWIVTLRNHLSKERCRKALQHLSVVCLDQSPLSNESKVNFGENCLFIKIIQFPSYFLAVEIISNTERPMQITYKYHLVSTTSKQASVTSNSMDVTVSNVVGLEVNLTSFCESSLQIKTHRTTDLMCNYENNCERELHHMIAVCVSHIPFISLLEDMDAEDIEHQGVQEEGTGFGLMCRIITLPDVEDVGSEVNLLAKDCLLQCTFRILDRINKLWTVELIMKEPPIRPTSVRHNALSTHVNFSYDATAHLSVNPASTNVLKSFLDDWTAIVHLYKPVFHYFQQLKEPNFMPSKLSEVYAYDYKSITLKYGKGLQFFVIITWSQDKKFQFNFGRCGMSPSSNAHALIRHYLTEMFNSNPDISMLMHVLHDTSSPLQSISRLPSTPLRGVNHKPTIVDQAFTVIPQTAFHYRITFLSTYCIDIYSRSDGMVGVRDGAFSQFDFAKVKSALTPTPGLSTFFKKYKDRRDVRNRADAEMDNPPSPFQRNNNPSNYGLSDLPHSSYSAANFTLLPHQSLEILCAPCQPMSNIARQPHLHTACPLEQFLGATLIHRFLDKCINAAEYQLMIKNISMAQMNADGTDGSLASAFVARSLQFVCHPHPQDMRQLILKVKPSPVSQPMENWQMEDLQVLEKYFELRIACSPYRHNVMRAFFNMISSPAHVLRDMIQLMRIELTRGRVQGLNPKWQMCLCLTAPPRGRIPPHGMPCIIVKEKVLLFVQLTQILPTPGPEGQNSSQHTIIVPLLHEPPKTMVSILPAALNGNSINSQSLQHIAVLLNRFDEMRQKVPNESTLSIAVRYLMENLTLPREGGFS